MSDDQHRVQKGAACRPTAGYEQDAIAGITANDRVPVVVHSHPFTDRPAFSRLDVTTMDQFRSWLTTLFPGRAFGFVVVGPPGLEAVLYDPRRNGFHDCRVTVPERWQLEADWAVPDDYNHVGDLPDSGRYDRGIRALGEAGQHRLQETTVAVVGCGGLCVSAGDAACADGRARVRTGGSGRG